MDFSTACTTCDPFKKEQQSYEMVRTRRIELPLPCGNRLLSPFAILSQSLASRHNATRILGLAEL